MASFSSKSKRKQDAVPAGKAKRQKEEPGVIEIDGVPPNVTPKLIEAVRATKTFFKHHPNDVIPPHLENVSVGGNNGNDDLIESIMDRVEAAKELENRKKESARRDTMSQLLKSWLESLTHRTDSSRSPSVGCLNYIWKLQTHERPSVRRMSLYLSGHLLLRNDECRDRWQDSLLDWISGVIEVKVQAKYASEILVWQKEALSWLVEFSNRFPDNNKFRVARMFMKQKGPSLYSEGDVGKNMAEWRRIRDIAIQHGSRLCHHVDELVQRAYECIDTLMPRVGLDGDAESDRKLSPEGLNDVNDDEDDDIDWEEGDVDVAQATHVAAVEQTLALMQVTGGLHGGDLEIRLNTQDDAATPHPMKDQAKARLQKIVTSLSTKHLPCLSTWVNSMSEADNLILKNGSLVAMSSESQHQRIDLSQRFMTVKRTVASVLSAASRLEINVHATNSSVPQMQPVFQTNVPRRHLDLSRTMERRKKGSSFNVTKKRSNRIQIKFNK